MPLLATLSLVTLLAHQEGVDGHLLGAAAFAQGNQVGHGHAHDVAGAGGRARRQEWLKLLAYDIAEVTALAGAGALVQGATGPGMDEERDGTVQGDDVPREVPSWA